MKKDHQEAYEDMIRNCPAEEVESVIKKLSSKLSKITVVNESFRSDPRKAFCEMKEEQLQDALEAYGKVPLGEVDLDRIPLIFARLQAAEAQIRNDLKNVQNLTNGEKDLKKQLEIAKRVLAEKIQPGGRA